MPDKNIEELKRENEMLIKNLADAQRQAKETAEKALWKMTYCNEEAQTTDRLCPNCFKTVKQHLEQLLMLLPEPKSGEGEG